MICFLVLFKSYSMSPVCLLPSSFMVSIDHQQMYLITLSLEKEINVWKKSWILDSKICSNPGSISVRGELKCWSLSFYLTGNNGTKGPSGVAGLPGQAGAKGENGEDKVVRGLKGTKGEVGSPGTPGETGPAGATGPQGNYIFSPL